MAYGNVEWGDTIKTILVTGGSSGIGRKVSEYYLNNNNTVIVLDKEMYINSHDNLYFYKTDLEKYDDIITVTSNIRENFENINIIIHAAGIIEELLGVKNINLEEMETVFKVNTFSILIIIKQLLELLINGNANILNIASINGLAKRSRFYGYASSKAALISNTMNLANELSKYNIRVNSISPSSVIGTNLGKSDKLNSFNSKVRLMKQSPLNRLITTEDILELITFLTSDRAKCINGQNIYIDCGLSIL